MSIKSDSTIRDVAELAQVSLGSVSNFLTGKKPVSTKARARIEAAIAELGFIPNAAVRVMRGGRSHAVAFITPDPGNPYLVEVARGIEDVAVAAGLVVVVCNTQGDSDREEHFARTLAEMRIVGAIAMAAHGTESEEYLQVLEASGAAVVVIGAGEPKSHYAALDTDNFKGGQLAMEHLVSRGHENIALFAGPGAEPAVRDRFAGASRAYADAGFDPTSLRRIDAGAGFTASRLEGAEQVLALAPPPTAVLCANDLLALAVETVALRRGLRIPEDIALVGYDDIDSAQLSTVPLTTVRQPQHELGTAAARLVLALAAGQRPVESDVAFEPELIIRAST